MTKSHRLERAQLIPRPRPEVFAFFCDASNLQRITPPLVGFRILTPGPILIAAGTLIDYELKLYGVPVRWRTRIEAFEPGQAFTDIQLAGPYRSWHHRHEFADVPGGTRIVDRIDYALPLGVLGSVAHFLFVERTLQKIFDFREARIRELFGAPSSSGGQEAGIGR